MGRVAFSNIRAHPVRLLSTALAVVLGIAFVAGTLIYSDTTRGAFDALFASDVNERELVVQAKSDFGSAQGPPQQTASVGVPPEEAERALAVDGVAEAGADFQGVAQVLDASGDPIGGGGAPTQGSNPPPVPALSDVEVREGRLPEAAGEVALDPQTASEGGYAVGDQVPIQAGGPVEDFQVVGIFGFEGDPDFGTSSFTIFDQATAEELFGAAGASDVAVLVEEGADLEAVQADLGQALGQDVEVVTGAEVAADNQADIGQFLGFIETFLLVFAGISLLVGAFLIFNTFTITVAQRTRELALLRAVGASRGQVLRVVLLEALVVGLVGSALGLGLGILLALGIRTLFEALGIGLPSGDLVIAARTPLIAIGVGTVVTLVAAVVPAVRGTRVAPVQAMREVAAPPSSTSNRLRLVVGLLLLVIGIGVLVFGLTGGGLPAVGGGSVAVILALALLSSLFAGGVARLVAAPVAATRGVPGELARENAARNPRRTASTASALMIGVGLVSFVLILAASAQGSIDQLLIDRFRAEFQVTTTDFAPLSGEVVTALRDVQGVETVDAESFAQVGVDGDATSALVVDPATLPRVYDVEMIEGDLDRLGDGTIVVGEGYAETNGLAVGDTLDVQLSPVGEPAAVEVVGVIDPASVGSTGVPLLVDDATYGAAVPGSQPSFVALRLADGVGVDVVRPAIDDALAAFPNVRVQDLDELRQDIATQTNQLLGGVFALLALSVLIALFGIVNTLNLSILERVRELGLLRALGMTRAQTRSMVRWESVVIAIFGGLLGLVLGVVFGVLAVAALRDEGFEVLVIPAWQLVAALVTAGIAGVVAGLWPARKASRTDVLRAIATE